MNHEFNHSNVIDPSQEQLLNNFRDTLHNALQTMGNRHVRPEYRHLWTSDNPTYGYCYVISELLHHLIPETTPKVLHSKEGTHWFLELPDGTPIDFARDQEYDYSKAKKHNFLTKTLSKRALTLGKMMGLCK
jgi:hypothetical protein